MDRGLSKEEKLSKARQAAAGQIQYGETKHGGIGAFNFEGDNDDVKTVTANKKVGNRATNSVSRKTLVEDVFSVAGNTTLPSYQEEGEEVDSFVSTTCSVVVEEAAGAKPSGTPPAEVMTPKRAGKTILDMSEMEEPTQTEDLNLENENMSLDLSPKKQEMDDNKTNSEADTAAGNESLTNSQEEECFKVLDERHENKIDDPKHFLEKTHNEKGPCPQSMMIAVQDIKEQMELAGTEDDQEFNITGYSDDLLLCLAEEKGSVNEILIHLDELAIAFQNHVEELRRKKEGAGVEETE